MRHNQGEARNTYEEHAGIKHPAVLSSSSAHGSESPVSGPMEPLASRLMSNSARKGDERALSLPLYFAHCFPPRGSGLLVDYDRVSNAMGSHAEVLLTLRPYHVRVQEGVGRRC